METFARSVTVMRIDVFKPASRRRKTIPELGVQEGGYLTQTTMAASGFIDADTLTVLTCALTSEKYVLDLGLKSGDRCNCGTKVTL
jgi:hypothetical protein